MKRPNFFLIGAPKCGTTSLAAWLAEHPQIFFSPVKEPHFFNLDYDREFRSLRKYERLFAHATAQHAAVGEGSTRYLYSRTAVPAILQYAKEPRFIVTIRNPVDMAYSLHEQTRFNGDEDEDNFERAWELQTARMYGAHVPNRCSDPQHLFYGQICRLGEQLHRLYQTVPRERVLVINLEHLKRDPRKQYRRILTFLGVEDDQRRTFPTHNAAKEPRFPILWRSITGMNKSVRSAGIRTRVGLLQFLSEHTLRERPRPPMGEAMRRRLQEYFADDIALLEELTGWDLTHWISEQPPIAAVRQKDVTVAEQEPMQ